MNGMCAVDSKALKESNVLWLAGARNIENVVNIVARRRSDVRGAERRSGTCSCGARNLYVAGKESVSLRSDTHLRGGALREYTPLKRPMLNGTRWLQ